jgi:hypothetical protein
LCDTVFVVKTGDALTTAGYECELKKKETTLLIKAKNTCKLVFFLSEKLP